MTPRSLSNLTAYLADWYALHADGGTSSQCPAPDPTDGGDARDGEVDLDGGESINSGSIVNSSGGAMDTTCQPASGLPWDSIGNCFFRRRFFFLHIFCFVQLRGLLA